MTYWGLSGNSPSRQASMVYSKGHLIHVRSLAWKGLSMLPRSRAAAEKASWVLQELEDLQKAAWGHTDWFQINPGGKISLNQFGFLYLKVT